MLENDESSETPIVPELFHNQCLSLLQLKEAVDLCISRLTVPSDAAQIPALILGSAISGEGEVFFLQGLTVGEFPESSEPNRALLWTDVTGYDSEIDKI